jgi:hypothetical protein
MLEHDPEKWIPVFRRDHAQIKEKAPDTPDEKAALDEAFALSIQRFLSNIAGGGRLAPRFVSGPGDIDKLLK